MCVSMSVCVADLGNEIPNHTKLFGMMKKNVDIIFIYCTTTLKGYIQLKYR